jgi:hypothetical protein
MRAEPRNFSIESYGHRSRIARLVWIIKQAWVASARRSAPLMLAIPIHQTVSVPSTEVANGARWQKQR